MHYPHARKQHWQPYNHFSVRERADADARVLQAAFSPRAPRPMMKLLIFLLFLSGALGGVAAGTRKTSGLKGVVHEAEYQSHDGRLRLVYPIGSLLDKKNPKRLRLEIDERDAPNAQAVEFSAEGDKFKIRKFSVQIFHKDNYPGDEIALPHVLKSQVAWFRKVAKTEGVQSQSDDRDIGGWPARSIRLTCQQTPKSARTIYDIAVLGHTSFVVITVGECWEIPWGNDAGEVFFDEKFAEDGRLLLEMFAKSIETKEPNRLSP